METRILLVKTEVIRMPCLSRSMSPLSQDREDRFPPQSSHVLQTKPKMNKFLTPESCFCARKVSSADSLMTLQNEYIQIKIVVSFGNAFYEFIDYELLNHSMSVVAFISAANLKNHSLIHQFVYYSNVL